MKLICEKNTQQARALILRAYHAQYGARKVLAVYEHGQWWVTQPSTGAQWAVNDAEGPGSTGGFCFEQVSAGEE